MDAASVSPSVVRNTVSCGERVRELTGRVAHPQAAHVSMRHFLGLLGNSAKNIVRKAHHNTDWTESVQVLVFYRQEFKVNMRKLIITQTVGSIFHLHCMNITSIFSTTHQHHCAGHCRQYVRRLKRKRGRFWWVRPAGWRLRSNTFVYENIQRKKTSNRADSSVVTMWMSPPRRTWHKCDCFSELRLLLSTFACSC